MDKNKRLDSIKVDPDYFKVDVRTKLKQVRYDLMRQCFSGFKMYYISFVEAMYEFFQTNSNNHRIQDPLFLLGIVIQKNQNLVKNQTFNLEEYLCKDFEKADHIANTVLEFYSGVNT